MTNAGYRHRGYTYVELLIATVIGSVLILSLSGLVGNALKTQDAVHAKTELNRQAAEAMQRMMRAVSHSRVLLLPLADNPNTNWPEHIREETVPASAPVGDSTKATAVLAVTLPAHVDLDHDGVPDADNDGDGQIDEDPPADNTNDGAAGIAGVDDNGDGMADDSTYADPASDNDEDDAGGDDVVDGKDDDGDGSVDEDTRSDANDDGQSGVAGVDDDGDGAIDEANASDDDEDGLVDEDGYDALVFHLDNGTLKMRQPVPWDTDGDTQTTGADYVESNLVGDVTLFRVERVPMTGYRRQLVDLKLEVTDPATGNVVSLHTRVRLGGAL